MFPSRLIALAALLTCTVPIRATSIVILRSGTRVYVGADSRRSYRETGETYEGTVCKIVPAGRMLFVASGLTYTNDEQVASIGAAVGRSSPTVSYAIEQFHQRMKEFLPHAIAAEGRVENNRARKGLILEAAFIGAEDNLNSVSVDWYRTNGNVSKPRITSERRTYSSAAPARYDFIFLGKRHAIDRYLGGRLPSIRSQSDAVAVITRLINLEISESPQTTAPPIDILELDAAGSRWLQRKPGCEVSLTGG